MSVKTINSESVKTYADDYLKNSFSMLVSKTETFRIFNTDDRQYQAKLNLLERNLKVLKDEIIRRKNNNIVIAERIVQRGYSL